MPRTNHFSEVGKTLGECQLLELELKLYIEHALEVIRNKLDGIIVFNFRGEDYDDAPLEKLIQVFAKLNGNAKLVKELHAFRKERNSVAHRAVIDCLDHEGELDRLEIRKLKPKLLKIRSEASRLRQAVEESSRSFLGHYYFPDESPFKK